MAKKYNLGDPPDKVWLELKHERGLVKRRGWIHRRLAPMPTNQKDFFRWCRRKFAWGTARYMANGYRPVVKAAYGNVNVTLLKGGLFPKKWRAVRDGKKLLAAARSKEQWTQ